MGSTLGTAGNGLSIKAIGPFGKALGWSTLSASRLGSANVGPPGRRLAALFTGGWPALSHDGEVLIEGGLLKGAAPPTVRKVWSSGRRCRRRVALVTVRTSKGWVSGPAHVDFLRWRRNVTDDAGDGLATRLR
jgi:hypothetical protein